MKKLVVSSVPTRLLILGAKVVLFFHTHASTPQNSVSFWQNLTISAIFSLFLAENTRIS